MELWRILVRAVFAYVFALAVMRIAGKRMVSHADVSSFVVAIIIGDMFDDLLWAEVPACAVRGRRWHARAGSSL